MYLVLLVRYLKKEILINEKNHKHNSANCGQTGTKYDSIRQKIARNLQKPHSGTNYFCSACERNNNNNKVYTHLVVSSYVLCTYLKTKGMQIKDVQKDVEQP